MAIPLHAITAGLTLGGKVINAFNNVRSRHSYTPQPINRSIDYGGFNQTGYGQMLNNALGGFDRGTQEGMKNLHNMVSAQGPSQQQLMGALSATGRGGGMQAWKAAQNQAQINAGRAYIDYAKMRDNQKYSLINQYGAGQTAYAGQQLQQQNLNMQQQQINLQGQGSAFQRYQLDRQNSFGNQLADLGMAGIGAMGSYKLADRYGLFNQDQTLPPWLNPSGGGFSLDGRLSPRFRENLGMY